MDFLNLAYGYWILLSVPLILLYLLKFRRTRYITASTLLWLAVSKDTRANSFYVKLRRNILLILQLIFIILCVIALVQPFLKTKSGKTKNNIVIIDCSASMSVKDVNGKSRLTAAKNYLINMVNELSGADKLMIIVSAGRVIRMHEFSSSHNSLKEFVDNCRWQYSGSDMGNALQLAETKIKQYKNGRITLLTDGNIPEIDNYREKIYVKLFGISNKNCGIAEYAVKKEKYNHDYYTAFASVKNYTGEKVKTLLDIFLDKKLIDKKELVLNSGEEKGITTKIFADKGILHYVLHYDEDLYEPDDEIRINLMPKFKLKTLLVTGGNIFITKAVSFDNKYELFTASPAEIKNINTSKYDIIIYDNIPGLEPEIIKQNNSSNYLFINSVPGIFADEKFLPDVSSIEFTANNDAIMNMVNFENISFNELSYTDLPVWAKSLAEVKNKPVIWSGTINNQKIIFWGFDLYKTDLPLNHSFLTLLYNSLKWLSLKKQQRNYYLCGDIIKTGNTPELNTEIIDPSGNDYKINDNIIRFEKTGTYKIIRDKKEFNYCVNFKNRNEADIKPSDKLIKDIKKNNINVITRTDWSYKHIWIYFAAAAFVVLLIEWYVYHRYFC